MCSFRLVRCVRSFALLPTHFDKLLMCVLILYWHIACCTWWTICMHYVLNLSSMVFDRSFRLCTSPLPIHSLCGYTHQFSNPNQSACSRISKTATINQNHQTKKKFSRKFGKNILRASLTSFLYYFFCIWSFLLWLIRFLFLTKNERTATTKYYLFIKALHPRTKKNEWRKYDRRRNKKCYCQDLITERKELKREQATREKKMYDMRQKARQ